uniref:U-scoloptoxin(10)-Sm2a n=1 Tax=Scolopendra morsitans TaxID=943129 RepID=TXA2A_SCOMO|nr:RecName: Full=U-scoloptoxin(10)-Sm2a; Short=U-SLPTX(10)-Sm2a; Flags: Precursor [Scolopendra morsitans]
MNKSMIILCAVLFLTYIIEENEALKVEDLPEPESYKRAKELAVKDAKGDKKAEGVAFQILKDNRKDCMTNCKLVPTCHLLSPECCPKQTPVCLQLDVVKSG